MPKTPAILRLTVMFEMRKMRVMLNLNMQFTQTQIPRSRPQNPHSQILLIFL